MARKNSTQNADQAARLEREAAAEDRRAAQHIQWAKGEAEEGRPGHSRMWANKGQANVQEADRLRSEAAKLRRR